MSIRLTPKGSPVSSPIKPDTSAAPQQPSNMRGTWEGRLVRRLPLVGDVVKALDKVSGDTTYTKPRGKGK